VFAREEPSRFSAFIFNDFMVETYSLLKLVRPDGFSPREIIRLN
jgi:hypothetical protein